MIHSLVKFTLIPLLAFIIGVVAGRYEVLNTLTAVEQEEVQLEEGLTDWQMFLLATALTESKYDTKAVGKGGDWGIFQETPIYVADVNRILSLQQEEKRYTHEDAFDIMKSIEMFEIYQTYYNPEKDIHKAIRKHNPGGKAIGYDRKVLENLQLIRRMEEVRKGVVEYYKGDV